MSYYDDMLRVLVKREDVAPAAKVALLSEMVAPDDQTARTILLGGGAAYSPERRLALLRECLELRARNAGLAHDVLATRRRAGFVAGNANNVDIRGYGYDVDDYSAEPRRPRTEGPRLSRCCGMPVGWMRLCTEGTCRLGYRVTCCCLEASTTLTLLAIVLVFVVGGLWLAGIFLRRTLGL